MFHEKGLKNEFSDAWDGVGREVVDQGTLETGQSLRHVCAKDGGEKMERSMREAINWRKRAGHSLERGQYCYSDRNRDSSARRDRLRSGEEED